MRDMQTAGTLPPLPRWILPQPAKVDLEVSFHNGEPCIRPVEEETSLSIHHEAEGAFQEDGKPYALTCPSETLQAIQLAHQWMSGCQEDVQPAQPAGSLTNGWAGAKAYVQGPPNIHLQIPACLGAKPERTVASTSYGVLKQCMDRHVPLVEPQLHDLFRSIECTLFVLGVPALYNREDLLQIWDPSDLHFNFLFLPYNTRRRHFTHFCFMNFASYEAALNFQSKWSQKALPKKACSTAGTVKNLEIFIAEVQGFAANLRHSSANMGFGEMDHGLFPAIFDDAGHPKDFYKALTEVCGAKGFYL